MLVTFFGISVFAFGLIHLIPGDPVMLMFGERNVDPATLAAMRAQLGLNRPLVVQYGLYVWRALHGDLGRSLSTHDSVLHEFLTFFPATVELAVSAMLIAVLLGIPAGIVAALRRGSTTDYTVMGLALTGYSMPIFWWAILLILLFSVILGITPVSGRIATAYYIQPVTGFMLIDSLMSSDQGAFRSAVSHLDPAGDCTWYHPLGGDCAHDPLGDAGGAERRLCAHRAGERVIAISGDRDPRPA